MKKVVAVTEVTSENNMTLTPIKDIEVGDYVFAQHGVQKVSRKYLPHELPTDGVDFLELTFDDGTTVKCTDTHRFLMSNDEWVQAGDIQLGDEFKLSGRTLAKVTEVEPFDLYDITVENEHCFRLENNVIAHNSKAVVGGGCFVAGTKIIMADGTHKEIQNVCVGDQVMTYSGAKTVLNTWDKETLLDPTPDCYTVTFTDGLSVTCSDTHPFMVDTLWVQAQDLKCGTLVDTPDGDGREILKVERLSTKHEVFDIEVSDVKSYLLENHAVVSNTGAYYAADNIFILGRQQEKEAKDVVGFNIMMNVEKSRYCREKSVFPIELRYDSGINKWSGMLDIAIELGFVVKPSNGWYSRVIDGVAEDQKFRKSATNDSAFWNPIMSNPAFNTAIEKRYMLSVGNMISDDNDAALAAEDEIDD